MRTLSYQSKTMDTITLQEFGELTRSLTAALRNIADLEKTRPEWHGITDMFGDLTRAPTYLIKGRKTMPQHPESVAEAVNYAHGALRRLGGNYGHILDKERLPEDLRPLMDNFFSTKEFGYEYSRQALSFSRRMQEEERVPVRLKAPDGSDISLFLRNETTRGNTSTLGTLGALSVVGKALFSLPKVQQDFLIEQVGTTTDITDRIQRLSERLHKQLQAYKHAETPEEATAIMAHNGLDIPRGKIQQHLTLHARHIGLLRGVIALNDLGSVQSEESQIALAATLRLSGQNPVIEVTSAREAAFMLQAIANNLDGRSGNYHPEGDTAQALHALSEKLKEHSAFITLVLPPSAALEEVRTELAQSTAFSSILRHMQEEKTRTRFPMNNIALAHALSTLAPVLPEKAKEELREVQEAQKTGFAAREQARKSAPPPQDRGRE